MPALLQQAYEAAEYFASGQALLSAVQCDADYTLSTLLCCYTGNTLMCGLMCECCLSCALHAVTFESHQVLKLLCA